MKTPSKPLPLGSRNVPGSKAYRAMQGAPASKPALIDHSFVADPRGGPPLVAGKGGVEVNDNRTRSKR